MGRGQRSWCPVVSRLYASEGEVWTYLEDGPVGCSARRHPCRLGHSRHQKLSEYTERERPKGKRETRRRGDEGEVDELNSATDATLEPGGTVSPPYAPALSLRSNLQSSGSAIGMSSYDNVIDHYNKGISGRSDVGSAWSRPSRPGRASIPSAPDPSDSSSLIYILEAAILPRLSSLSSGPR
jgi:hypothetical protein